jgi:hypothetical protein
MEVNSEAYHEQECVICLDDVETEWRDLECHHRYHKSCIENWIAVRAKCPMCMKTIKSNETDERNTLIEEMHHIAIRRFMTFMCLIVCVIIVMVLCSS